MKKYLCAMLVFALCLGSLGCAKQEDIPDTDKWLFSVVCPMGSDEESYVISYDEGQTVRSDTGMLTMQNRNDFAVTVHLSCDGQEEQVFDIQPGGVTVFSMAVKQAEYTVGIHADVAENTEIKLAVYDGEVSEVY